MQLSKLNIGIFLGFTSYVLASVVYRDMREFSSLLFDFFLEDPESTSKKIKNPAEIAKMQQHIKKLEIDEEDIISAKKLGTAADLIDFLKRNLRKQTELTQIAKEEYELISKSQPLLASLTTSALLTTLTNALYKKIKAALKPDPHPPIETRIKYLEPLITAHGPAFFKSSLYKRMKRHQQQRNNNPDCSKIVCAC